MVRRDSLTEKFRTDGFVVERGFLDESQVGELRSNVDRYIADIVPGLEPSEAFYEHVGRAETLKQMHRLDQHDAWFRGFLHDGPARAVAAELLGEEVVPKNIEWFNKPPGAGLPTPPHQDGFYFKLEPCEAITMWIAIDPADEENGCVRYVRGSHLDGMRPHGRSGTLGFSQGLTDFGTPEDLSREVAVEAQPGDLLAHHALTVHRAGGNESRDRSRRAVGFVYYAKSAREDRAAHAEYQETLARDLADEGRI